MKKINLFFLLVILLFLPFTVFSALQIQQYLSRASIPKANIIVKTEKSMGEINTSWSNFSQGGEEPPPMLEKTIDKMKKLSVRYIRLDHIYDSYDIVKKNNNGFVFDFSILDKTVEDILQMGALPFFSLSYMPPVFTNDGSVISVPDDWNNWKDLVRATIEHYSSRFGMNLTNVYYEVWNEPELPQFGSWKLTGHKDYKLLYFYAAEGAKLAKYTNKFFLGGPAVGSFYPDWISKFADYIIQNNLRLDFYSWHRYHKNPHIFINDAQGIRKILNHYPDLKDVPLVLSEWGIDSSNNTLTNSNQSAAFTVHSASKFQKNIDLAFNFEVKDGPPPSGGNWGLLTHEKNNPPLAPKPKYYAFQALNKLEKNRVEIVGTNYFIDGLAAKTDNKITVLLANYDKEGKNTENVPVTFTGLSNGSYKLKYAFVLEDRSGFFDLVSTNGVINKTFLMKPQDVLYLELEKEGALANFLPGTSRELHDLSLVLKYMDLPISIPITNILLSDRNNIDFDLKFLDGLRSEEFKILELTTKQNSNFTLTKEFSKGTNFLAFSFRDDKREEKITVNIDDWNDNNWHHLSLSLSNNFLQLTAGQTNKIEVTLAVDNLKAEKLKIYPFNGSIDNLYFISGGNLILKRSFDGTF